MDDDFFKYLAVTDQLDEFLGLEEDNNEDDRGEDFESNNEKDNECDYN